MEMLPYFLHSLASLWLRVRASAMKAAGATLAHQARCDRASSLHVAPLKLHLRRRFSCCCCTAVRAYQAQSIDVAYADEPAKVIAAAAAAIDAAEREVGQAQRADISISLRAARSCIASLRRNGTARLLVADHEGVNMNSV